MEKNAVGGGQGEGLLKGSGHKTEWKKKKKTFSEEWSGLAANSRPRSKIRETPLRGLCPEAKEDKKGLVKCSRQLVKRRI